MEAKSKISPSLVQTTLDGRYEILSLIASGGTGSVYKARHCLLDKFVAVKVLHAPLAADEGSRQRFRREATAIASLAHTNIVNVLSVGTTESGQPYLVMEYLEGESLSAIIKSRQLLSLTSKLSIFIEICQALSHAHKLGVLHRDLKPGNVIVATSQDAVPRVKVIDFGLAKFLPSGTKEFQSLTQTGQLFGSPFYMSPEQCAGKELDERSDIYSLGCLMYEVLTGVPPFAGENAMATFFKHVHETPPRFAAVAPEAKIPPPLELVVFKCLAKSPEERFPSMDALSGAISAWQVSGDGAQLPADAGSLFKTQALPPKRSLKMPVLIGSLLSLLLSVLGFGIWASFKTPSHPDLDLVNPDGKDSLTIIKEADVLERRGRKAAAEDAYKKAVEAAGKREPASLFAEAQANLRLGEFYYRAEKWQESIAPLKKSISCYESLKGLSAADADWEAEEALWLSRSYVQLNNRAKAEEYARFALRIAREKGVGHKEVWALYFLSQNMLDTGQPGKANEFALSAVQAMNERAFLAPGEQATIYSQLGETYTRCKMYAEAETALKKALKLCDISDSDDPTRKAVIASKLSRALLLSGNLESARQYCDSGLSSLGAPSNNNRQIKDELMDLRSTIDKQAGCD